MSLISSLRWLLLSLLLLWSTGCEPSPFNPDGYRCETTKRHCLNGYTCVNQRCVELKKASEQSSEPTQDKGSDGGSKEPPPERSTEPPPERSTKGDS